MVFLPPLANINYFPVVSFRRQIKEEKNKNKFLLHLWDFSSSNCTNFWYYPVGINCNQTKLLFHERFTKNHRNWSVIGAGKCWWVTLEFTLSCPVFVSRLWTFVKHNISELEMNLRRKFACEIMKYVLFCINILQKNLIKMVRKVFLSQFSSFRSSVGIKSLYK